MNLLIVCVILVICYGSETCNMTNISTFVSSRPWKILAVVVVILWLSKTLEGLTDTEQTKCKIWSIFGKDAGAILCEDNKCSYTGCPNDQGSCTGNGITCTSPKTHNKGGGCNSGGWFGIGNECDQENCCVCPAGQTWDKTKCVCPAGQTWDKTKCVCPAGQTWDKTKCVCPAGQTWDTGRKECKPPLTGTHNGLLHMKDDTMHALKTIVDSVNDEVGGKLSDIMNRSIKVGGRAKKLYGSPL